MTRILLALFTTACVPGPEGPDPAWYRCDATPTDGSDHPDAAHYQRLVEAALSLGTPAVSVAVISPDGPWIGAGGQADIHQSVAAEPCQKYHVASVTKMFAAASTLRLVEDGRLDLDDRAREHLPADVVDEMPNLAGPGGATVRDLLQHTSGIPDYLTFDYFLDAFNGSLAAGSAAEELERVYGLAPLFVPGTDFEYSNANYLLLSLVLEEVAQQPAYATVHDQVTTPLGLTHSVGRSEHPDAVVRGYMDLHGNGTLVDHTALTEAVMSGPGKLDGGMVSTASDVATLVRALAEGTLLGPEAHAEMVSFRDYGRGEDDGLEDGYGLGLATLSTRFGRAVGHYGTVHPYQTLAWHFPERDTTVVLAANGYIGEVGDWINSEAPFALLFSEEVGP